MTCSSNGLLGQTELRALCSAGFEPASYPHGVLYQTELHDVNMAPLIGLEPTYIRLRRPVLIQLSYKGIVWWDRQDSNLQWSFLAGLKVRYLQPIRSRSRYLKSWNSHQFIFLRVRVVSIPNIFCAVNAITNVSSIVSPIHPCRNVK
jgi:hypothetical protein